MAYQFEDIKDSVAIVTGSGRGIGKEIAHLFAQHGAKVVVSDIDADVCEAAAKEIADEGGEVMHVVCDITKMDQVENLMKQTIDKWGKIDHLINNAGITKDGLFLRMKPEQWNFVVNINLTGTYNCCFAAVNYMRKARKGNIINLSSIARHGNPGQANYAAAKAGIVGLTKSLAKELAPMGIRVNCVAPGFVHTRLTDAIPEKIREEMIKQIPLKRTGEPIDIAKPILFLCSDLAGYITGQVLDVNGGLA
ncbi:MAG: 3-oxoacyl-ACP reductase FabG [Candidatus Hydrogenedentota bacterium]|nr:MAG: 3-oxoacyl-ACP reductase FabG [Candidatus Hydrogenedentota bacterium]